MTDFREDYNVSNDSNISNDDNNTSDDSNISNDDNNVVSLDSTNTQSCTKGDKNKKKKLNYKRVALVITALLCVLFLVFAGVKLYKNYKAEMLRLSEINKVNLDLKTIIDTTDEVGFENGSLQLNWKEITALASVHTNNYTEQVDKALIEDIANQFIDENNKVKSFEEVLAIQEFKDRQKERAEKYLSDLEYHGYMPERLEPNSKQAKFIDSIKDSAIENYKTSKILPSITIAQAILESNWGDSNLTKEANNLFGIKADYFWKGDKVTFETNEFHNTMITDKFRKYATLKESIDDHSDFLIKNDRYKENGVFDAKTYKEQALALQNSGYSTAEDENGEKTYAKMLEQIIRQYNLQIIDSKTINNN